MELSKPLTFVYKHVDEIDLKLDLYPPCAVPGTDKGTDNQNEKSVPLVVYFHGGGLTVGDRKNRVVATGFAFCSRDYRLLIPSSGHDIVDDIKNVFKFIANDLNTLLRHSSATLFQINPSGIAVAGSSAGGLCCYFAAMFAAPKPVALVGLYAMGGDYLTEQYLVPKTKVFFRGRELLDPKDFSEFLYPSCKDLKPLSESPLSYHPKTYRIPGYPANPRMLLTRLLLQAGNCFDYYTNEHEPSLSSKIRDAFDRIEKSPELIESKLKPLIPERRLRLFPQFDVNPNWPPCFLIHGTSDTAVLVRESLNMTKLLKENGVDVRLETLEGLEHSFDYAEGAEEEFGGLFDEVKVFLSEHLLAANKLSESTREAESRPGS